MPEDATQKYLIRDTQGNVYGPADGALLREWVGQGRIVGGMFIAERETRQWVEASTHPAVADLLALRSSGQSVMAPAAEPVSPSTGGPVTTQLPGPAQAMTAPRGDLEVVPYQNEAMGQAQNVAGLVGFIAAIAAVVSSPLFCVPLCNCIGGPLTSIMALTAVVLGAVGLYQIRQKPGFYRGRGLALSAVVIGCVLLFLFVIGLALVIISGLGNRGP